MKFHLITLLVVIASFSLQAQPLNQPTEEMMIRIGDDKLAESDYYNALDWYNKAYKAQQKKDNNLRFKIAKLHCSLRDYNKAERWFARTVKSDKNGEMPQALYYLAMAQKRNAAYPEAIASFESYLGVAQDEVLKAKAKLEIAGAKMALKMQQDADLTIKNAGKTVNSKFSEFSPRYVGDELYYGTLSSKNVILLDGKEGDYHAKIFVASGVDEKKGFATATPLGEDINRKGFHTGNQTFSEDGQKMFFTRSTLSGNVVEMSEIYVAEKNGEGFGAATLLVGPNGDWIAKHPAPGELFGKDVLFFVSNMDGGYGGDDIYYCTSNGDGTYGMPVNIGEGINTSSDEETPFYREGKLWFSSNGHISMGGLDIFSTTWNGSAWSSPENLGPGYNSSVDDFGFFVDKSGFKGALVSNRPSVNSLKSKTCCDDIFLANITPIIVDVNAVVLDIKNKNLGKGKVQLFEMVGKKAVAKGAKSGNANFALELGKAYMMICSADGFYPDTLTFNTANITKSKTLIEKFHLKPVEPETITVYINQPIRLNQIYYDYNDDKILPEAEQDLNTLLDLMKQYAEMKIELSSHTDSRGGKLFNERLSQRRADSAKQWLVNHGVASDRVHPVGYGESQILNQCTNGVKCTDEEHRFNRRTEFKIIEGPTEIKIPKVLKKGDIGYEEALKKLKMSKLNGKETGVVMQETSKKKQ